ncbi:TPA: hypothetical protein NPP08_000831 [Klebsiella quasipneumoniae subsp. similipneumoniae]|nr:hypothetical protein [Klebsiella aerogenes]HCI6421262.1 hypothetical protein [Klebsiella quasipneumoniae subsp. similipneumoniae]
MRRRPLIFSSGSTGFSIRCAICSGVGFPVSFISCAYQRQ